MKNNCSPYIRGRTPKLYYNKEEKILKNVLKGDETMKNLKKLTGIILTLAMLLAMAAPAFAANVTINVQTPEGATDAGETYTAYKIFDATVKGETSAEGTDPTGTVSKFDNVAYSIDSTSPFFAAIQSFADEGKTVFTLTQVNGTTKYNVTLADGVESYSAAALAEALKGVANIDNAKVATGKSPLSIDNKGYYMILSSLGSVAIIDTIGQNNMTITTKNQLPTLNKTITGITAGNAQDGKAGTASYGSTVTFKIAVDIPTSAVGAITVHDTMDEQLTYVAMTALDGVTETAAPTDGCTREFVISAEKVAASKGGTVDIVYTATLNKDVATATDFKNIAKLTYANYTSAPSEVKVNTYEFDLVKTTSDGTLLDGASFELYTAATGGEAIKFTLADGVYSVDAAGTATIAVTGGKVTVKGLAAGTYYLEETVTPDGYNTLKERKAVDLNGNIGATVDGGKLTEGTGVQVINLTGAELPSTGGIGTTIFYIVGGLLIAGAGIMLITKKRVNNQEM